MTVTGEEAVRRYLAYLTDPSGMRDDERIDQLERKLSSATDPIEKIRLASDLYRAQNVDGAEFRDGFVTHAKAWAEDNGIVAEAFLQMGVPAEDLRAAGFTVGRAARSADGDRTSGRRAPRVSVEEIRDRALRISGPFTTSELRDLVGGTPATVRKALDGLLAEGKVVDLGPDRNWSSRGRAPNLYRRA